MKTRIVSALIAIFLTACGSHDWTGVNQTPCGLMPVTAIVTSACGNTVWKTTGMLVIFNAGGYQAGADPNSLLAPYPPQVPNPTPSPSPVPADRIQISKCFMMPTPPAALQAQTVAFTNGSGCAFSANWAGTY